MNDIRMIEIGEQLALAGEAGEHIVAMQAELEDLDGGPLFKLAVGALAKVDGRHSATANFTAKLPGPESSGGDAICAGPTFRDLGGGASQKTLRPLARTEQRHDFVFERIVANAFSVKQSAPKIGVNIESGEEYRPYARPSLRRHLGSSSRNSHALASVNSRLMVAGESCRSVAASSMESPPKNRSSTIRACRESRICKRRSASSSASKSRSRSTAGSFISEISTRSEERRVGKECRSRWSPYH